MSVHHPDRPPGLSLSWPIDASTSVVQGIEPLEGIFFPSPPSLPRFAVERGFFHFFLLVGFHKKKKKKEKEPSSSSSCSSSSSFSCCPPPPPQKRDTRRSTSTDRSQATGTEFSSVRNASLRLCPGFTTLYSGLRFMRYHRSRPGPFHK